MVYFKVNNILYPATIFGKETDREWNNRSSKAITLSMSYEDAKKLFVDGLVWSQVYQEDEYESESGEIITPPAVETDQSAYEIIGDITVHKDGRVTVKIGKATADELLAELEGVIG